jgi:hypothetical protein
MGFAEAAFALCACPRSGAETSRIPACIASAKGSGFPVHAD